MRWLSGRTVVVAVVADTATATAAAGAGVTAAAAVPRRLRLFDTGMHVRPGEWLHQHQQGCDSRPKKHPDKLYMYINELELAALVQRT